MVCTNRKIFRHRLLPLAVALALGAAACGGSSPGGGGPSGPAACENGVAFDSTFDAVQQVVFDGKGCTNSGCHGNGSSAGGLDLSRGHSWANLHDVPAQVNGEKRILPGSATRSVLYQKLAAATLGERAPGSPMPIGLAPLTPDELELVRWWIYGGAPETGVVRDAIPYVPGCLPAPEPLRIKQLEPPAPGTGVQLVMPEFTIPPGLEVERCFASYYDVCDQVPDELKFEEPTRPGLTLFAFSSRELRMDPGSHHLIASYALVPTDMLDDPSYGGFTCAGGETPGVACEPLDTSSCGSGQCVSKFRDGFTCGGYGPQIPGLAGRSSFPIGGAQRSQDYQAYPDGVFNRIPCQGIIHWNPHAFNLTTGDQTTSARLNYYFADIDNLRYPGQGGLIGPIFRPNAAPYTEETYCSNFTLPRGARLFQLSSHTHQRGKHFWVNLPDGTKIYENFSYNDPQEERFEPPIPFDSTVATERTLEFCATYNNGLNADGTPNTETVTRASRIPESARQPGIPGMCKPIACVNDGAVGRTCDGEDDDATCDTEPGKGDGDCDACRITGGESTQNEMFLILPGYYVVDLG